MCDLRAPAVAFLRKAAPILQNRCGSYSPGVCPTAVAARGSCPAGAPALASSAFAGGRSMSSWQVLVVDDDEEMVAAIRIALEAEGMRVRSARNGVQALALLDASRPDVVLVDLVMPVAGGWDFVNRLRSSREINDVPVVMMSAMRSLPQEAERLGVGRWLQKPFDVDALLGAVRGATPPLATGT